MRNHKAARDSLWSLVASEALRIRPLAVKRLLADFRTPRSLRPKRIAQMWLNKAPYKDSAGRSMTTSSLARYRNEGIKL